MSLRLAIQLAGLCLLIFSATLSLASVPPPPVNQGIGFPDVVMNDMSLADCLGCHGAPQNSPVSPNRGYLPDRHHLYVDTPISPYSASPFPENSPSNTHNCITCHRVEWQSDPSHPSGGAFAFSREPSSPEFRDCLRCHQQVDGVASVHHLAPRAQEAKCHLCHGNVVNDPNGDHRIPDTGVVNVTPRPGLGSGEIGETGNRLGGCRYCHEGGVDDASGITVPANERGNSNHATHHGTGIARGGTDSEHTCLLCHNWGLEPGPLNGPYNIRGCERCHGMGSLHSIQFDAAGNGIVPGEEDPFYGHVGSNLDCRGCHGPNPTFPDHPYPGDPGFEHMGEQSDCLGCHREGAGVARMASGPAASSFGPVVPHIASISSNMAISGHATTLILSGSGFYTGEDPMDIPARVVLIAQDGSANELPTSQIVPTMMEFTIPPETAPGSYSVVASKGELNSNIVNLTVLPTVIITEAQCTGNRVSLTGSGFGRYLDARRSGTSVTLRDGGERCSIDSWNNHHISARCPPGSSGVVQVNSIFGSASIDLACSSGGRPGWWSIWSWWSSWSWSRR